MQEVPQYWEGRGPAVGIPARGQPRAAFGHTRREQGGTSFGACFLASVLRVWPSCSEGHEELYRSTGDKSRADPGSEELGDAPAVPRKSLPVSSYLTRSSCVGQKCFPEEGTGKAFVGRRLWPHLPDVSPPRFLSKQSPCCRHGGPGDGEDWLAAR